MYTWSLIYSAVLAGDKCLRSGQNGGHKTPKNFPLGSVGPGSNLIHPVWRWLPVRRLWSSLDWLGKFSRHFFIIFWYGVRFFVDLVSWPWHTVGKTESPRSQALSVLRTRNAATLNPAQSVLVVAWRRWCAPSLFLFFRFSALSSSSPSSEDEEEASSSFKRKKTTPLISIRRNRYSFWIFFSTWPPEFDDMVLQICLEAILLLLLLVLLFLVVFLLLLLLLLQLQLICRRRQGFIFLVGLLFVMTLIIMMTRAH